MALIIAVSSIPFAAGAADVSEKEAAVKNMLVRTNNAIYPFIEFGTPLYLLDDYDESLGFKASMTTYMAGRHLTSKGMWVNIFENAIESFFFTNDGFFEESLVDAKDEYCDAITFVETFLNSFEKDLFDSVPELKKFGTLRDVLEGSYAVLSDTLYQCANQAQFLDWLSKNASKTYLAAAAKNSLNRRFSNVISLVLDKVVDAGLEKGIEISGKAASAAVEKTMESIITNGAFAFLSGVNLALIIIEVKDIVYSLSGASKPLQAYLETLAYSMIRLDLCRYFETVVKSEEYDKAYDIFYEIRRMTMGMYDNVSPLLGSIYNKMCESDKYFVSERDELLMCNINNYVKKDRPKLTPYQKAKSVQLFLGKTVKFPVENVRYGLKMTYEKTKKSSAFSVDKDGNIKASSKYEGTGQIMLTFKQNGIKRKYLVEVSVSKEIGKTAITAASSTQSSISLTWKKAANATGYHVYRMNSAGKYVKIKGTTSLSYTDTGLKTATAYSYRILPVRKTDVVYATGTASAAKTVRTQAKVGKVTGLKITTAGKDNYLKLSWNAQKDITGFQVYRSTSGKSGTYKRLATLSGKQLNLADTGLKSATPYYYAVRAYRKTSSGYAYGDFVKIDLSTRLSKSFIKARVERANYLMFWLWGRVSGSKMDKTDRVRVKTKNGYVNYYLVKDKEFKSIAQIKTELSKYMNEDAYKNCFTLYGNPTFIERNGKLYGNEHWGELDDGLSGECLRLDNIALSDKVCTFKISEYSKNPDFEWMSAKNPITTKVTMRYKNGQWIFDGYPYTNYHLLNSKKVWVN